MRRSSFFAALLGMAAVPAVKVVECRQKAARPPAGSRAITHYEWQVGDKWWSQTVWALPNGDVLTTQQPGREVLSEAMLRITLSDELPLWEVPQ